MAFWMFSVFMPTLTKTLTNIWLELSIISPMNSSMPPWMLRCLKASSRKYGDCLVFSRYMNSAVETTHISVAQRMVESSYQSSTLPYTIIYMNEQHISENTTTFPNLENDSGMCLVG